MSPPVFLVSPLEQHEYLLPTYFTLNEIRKMTQIQKLKKTQTQTTKTLIYSRVEEKHERILFK